MTNPRDPHSIVGNHTAYEIIATDGTTDLRLAFSVRRTRERLAANMKTKASAIVTKFDLGENAMIEDYSKADGWRITGNGRNVYVRFSDRTERECYWDGKK